ncbi:hypothetical protein Y032_0037g3504 [Ancylostoma ceylanicum]|uniref:Uncharacterized protein n=1 Tax=Ancylostoma ceylanicum TaxID=53326 RepID=A0A016UKG9_9BILA|nr:hypothetical protein Y032_0037g3504 [Ancylostoma ceylanicum]
MLSENSNYVQVSERKLLLEDHILLLQLRRSDSSRVHLAGHWLYIATIFLGFLRNFTAALQSNEACK